jgi:hypothetical protein
MPNLDIRQMLDIDILHTTDFDKPNIPDLDRPHMLDKPEMDNHSIADRDSHIWYTLKYCIC